MIKCWKCHQENEIINFDLVQTPRIVNYGVGFRQAAFKAIVESCSFYFAKRQKVSPNKSYAEKIFFGRLEVPVQYSSGRIYRQLAFSSTKTNLTNFLSVRASAHF